MPIWVCNTPDILQKSSIYRIRNICNLNKILPLRVMYIYKFKKIYSDYLRHITEDCSVGKVPEILSRSKHVTDVTKPLLTLGPPP